MNYLDLLKEWCDATYLDTNAKYEYWLNRTKKDPNWWTRITGDNPCRGKFNGRMAIASLS